MSQLIELPLNWGWFRYANKYIENLYVQTISKHGTITVHRDTLDDKFKDEFDYIIENMGF